MRVRGLKSFLASCHGEGEGVALHAGAWIEINPSLINYRFTIVALHAGAWIEIIDFQTTRIMLIVALHAGAWIEIVVPILPVSRYLGRTPCGCVD